MKDEKVAAVSLILLSEIAKDLEMNTDDLLVAHALCSLGDMSSASAQTSQSNEVDDFKQVFDFNIIYQQFSITVLFIGIFAQQAINRRQFNFLNGISNLDQ